MDFSSSICIDDDIIYEHNCHILQNKINIIKRIKFTTSRDLMLQILKCNKLCATVYEYKRHGMSQRCVWHVYSNVMVGVIA